MRVDPSCERADAAVLMQIGIMLGYITGGIFVQARAQQCCCPRAQCSESPPTVPMCHRPDALACHDIVFIPKRKFGGCGPELRLSLDTVAAGAWPGVLEARHRCSGIQFPTNHFELWRIAASIARHEKTGILDARH